MDEKLIAQALKAWSLTLTMITEDLAKAGVFDQVAFSDRLRKLLDDAEADRDPARPPEDDADLTIARVLADAMDPRPRMAEPIGWTPVVVEGGLKEGDSNRQPRPDE